jgi:hypothetical protein
VSKPFGHPTIIFMINDQSWMDIWNDSMGATFMSSSSSALVVASSSSGSSRGTTRVEDPVERGAVSANAALHDPESAAAVAALDSVLGAVRGDVVVDALAFADPTLSGIGASGSDEEVAERTQVESLIAEEMRRFAPRDYLGMLGPVPAASWSDAVAEDMRRVESGGPAPALREAGKGAPPPGATAERAVECWSDSINRLRVRAEELNGQAVNLALQGRYGVEAWRRAVTRVERGTEGLERENAELQLAIDAVTALRQQVNQRAAVRIQRAEKRLWEVEQSLPRLEEALNKRAKLGE